MRRAFEKWHGLGNDFAVVFSPPEPDWWRDNAAALCDRHRGIGADGILLVGKEPPRMLVINADGSEPEMCGNGLRCVVAALAAKLGQTQGSIELATGAGPIRCDYLNVDHSEWFVRYAAGAPSFVARDAGVDLDGEDVELETGGHSGLVVSIGNPHWVFFDHPGTDALAEHGARLENDDRFANRTNVEYVTRRDDGAWQVDVWERGVGITQACGTGATAVAAAIVRTDRARPGEALTIALPGGDLQITGADDGPALVEGSATRVYRGELQ